MPRLAWLTDVHLNWLDFQQQALFYAHVRSLRADFVVLGGDIAESGDVLYFLKTMAGDLHCPLAFVLGNHDFYYSSIHHVRQQVAALCREHANLTYLTASDYLSLTPRVALIGHDGWADGRAGDYAASNVVLSDYGLIAELAGLNKRERREVLHALGDEAARHVRRVLPLAAGSHDEVWLLTHVPPLREACWHEGRISDDHWAPHFTCQAVGEAILEIMPDFPDRRLTVLCGHTHSEGLAEPLPNVRILTGGAVYGQPRVTRTFELA